MKKKVLARGSKGGGEQKIVLKNSFELCLWSLKTLAK